MLELAHRAEAAQRDKDAATAAAVAREEVLRAELQQARARADTISHSLTEVGSCVSPRGMLLRVLIDQGRQQ